MLEEIFRHVYYTLKKHYGIFICADLTFFLFRYIPGIFSTFDYFKLKFQLCLEIMNLCFCCFMPLFNFYVIIIFIYIFYLCGITYLIIFITFSFVIKNPVISKWVLMLAGIVRALKTIIFVKSS